MGLSKNSTADPTRIALLDNRLANQIAAGEVVERPASVVKELIENCIDADAKKIEVEIERGGTRLIRITDDGKGIHKDDLALALTRHATSKIKTTQDLASISSLGFRGEALASISSVSKLCLTSRQRSTPQLNQEFQSSVNNNDSAAQAWQAVASGREMQVEILPAAAQEGTRIEVADLFFNTPARQKFLRSEKTEFNHIEEVFKRHALANFAISFVLKHNHKVVKRVPACGEPSQYKKRIANICGKAFADNAIAFSCQHELVQLNGWLGAPSFHRSESDIQYVFINGRPVKDKTLNHAIKQAYAEKLPPGRMPTYVIFVEMDPAQVDVNVHPTKHEVRFSEQRLIHDLLAKSISESIGQSSFEDADSQHENQGQNQRYNQTQNQNSLSENIASHLAGEEKEDALTTKNHLTLDSKQSFDLNANSTQEPPVYFKSKSFSGGANRANPVEPKSSPASDQNKLQAQNFAGAIYRQDGFSLAQIDGQSVVIKNDILIAEFIQLLLQKQKVSTSKALLFPLPITLKPEILERPQVHQQLECLGFVYSVMQQSQQLLLKQVPLWLADFSTTWIVEQLQQWFDLPLARSELIDKIVLTITEQPSSTIDYILSAMHDHIFAGSSWRVLQKQLLSELFNDHNLTEENKSFENTNNNKDNNNFEDSSHSKISIHSKISDQSADKP